MRLTRLYFELELLGRTCVNVHDMYFASYPRSYTVYRINITVIVSVVMAVKQTLSCLGSARSSPKIQALLGGETTKNELVDPEHSRMAACGNGFLASSQQGTDA
jgi:hypothetical protein